MDRIPLNEEKPVRKAAPRSGRLFWSRLLIVLCIVCLVGSFVIPMFRFNVYSRASVACGLILPALCTLLIPLLGSPAVYLMLRANGSTVRKSLIVSITVFFVNGMLVLTMYQSGMPHIQPVTVADAPGLFTDFRKAAAVLSDGGETNTVFGVCGQKRYRLQFRYENAEWERVRGTLILPDGTEVASSGEADGIYTVTYCRRSRLPVQIEPYDPECGENVLAAHDLLSQLEDDPPYWMPRVFYVSTEKLERPFPEMLLRVSFTGQSRPIERRFTAEEGSVSVPLLDPARMTVLADCSCTAQLFCVDGSPAFPQEYPISNRLEFRIPSKYGH